MTVRFHLSCDADSGCWYLEAHDIQDRRWFLVAEASWPVQLHRVSDLGVSKEELFRLASLQAAGKLSAWLKAVEIDREKLMKAGFVLQPTTAALPRA